MCTSNHNVLPFSQWFHFKSWLFYQIRTSHFASQWANLPSPSSWKRGAVTWPMEKGSEQEMGGWREPRTRLLKRSFLSLGLQVTPSVLRGVWVWWGKQQHISGRPCHKASHAQANHQLKRCQEDRKVLGTTQELQGEVTFIFADSRNENRDPCSIHPWSVLRQGDIWAWNRSNELKSS